jgi:hypothetical protein
VDKTTRPVDTEKGTIPAADTTLFAASWDVFYQDAQGLECHLQLKATSLAAVLDQAKSASMAITGAGGKPSRRIHGDGGTSHNGDKANGDKPKENGNGEVHEPTYIDERGTRRCNRKLTDGSVCGRPVTEKEGRYGMFWSCPNYKAHAPAPVPAR